MAFVKPNRMAKVVFLLVMTAAFVLALFANYLSSSALELGRKLGLFVHYNTSIPWSQRNTFQNISITPAGWTFSVWGIIYMYQAVLMAYLWSTAFRRAFPDGPFLCCEPDLAPYGLLIAHAASSLFNMAWIIMIDQADFNFAILVPLALVLFGIMFSLYVGLIVSYWTLYEEKPDLQRIGHRVDYWLTVGLVQNGLSLYAGWTTIASFLNVDLALVYFGENDETSSSIACFAAIMAIVLIYAICDLTIIDTHTRFVFTPHLVVIWACFGSLARNYSPGAATSIMTISLICIVALALIVKLVLVIIRTRINPIFGARVDMINQEDKD